MFEKSLSKAQKNTTAAAIQYQVATGTAKLTAAGSGVIGERILELARKHNIPIHEDASLVALLEQLPMNSDVPDEALILISEALCFLYELEKSCGA